MSNIDCFKELQYFNEVIEKPKIKHLKNVDLLAEQPFYEQLRIIKTDQHGYAMLYKVKIVKKKDLIVQLEASGSIIKDLLNDLLNETKGLSDYCKGFVKKIQS